MIFRSQPAGCLTLTYCSLCETPLFFLKICRTKVRRSRPALPQNCLLCYNNHISLRSFSNPAFGSLALRGCRFITSSRSSYNRRNCSMSGFFSALLEKQHQRFSIEGVWDMKRKILLLTLLCAIIVFSILSSALSCTIQPGPGGFSVTVRNQHTWQTLWFYRNGTRIAIINPMTNYVRNDFIASDIVRIWNADASVFLHDIDLNDSWLVNGHLTFTYTNTSGGVIHVTAVLDDER